MPVRNVKEVLSEECERIGLVRHSGRGKVPMSLESDRKGRQFIVLRDLTRYGMPPLLPVCQHNKLREEVAKLVRRYNLKVLDHVDDHSM